MKQLKALYIKKTSLREKVLLLLVLITLALIWLLFASDRLMGAHRQYVQANRTVKGQEQWLKDRDYFTQQLADAMAQLDASKTFSSTELVSRIDALAQQAGVERYSINPPQSETSGQFTVHSIRLNVQRVDLELLIRFSDVLETLSPYITLDRMEVFVDRNDPTLHNANIYLSSMEMNQPAS